MSLPRGELNAEATVAKSATVQTDGGKQVTREIEFYNLDAIISVGCRVKFQRGVQFFIWMTQRLREYIVKGFAMDDERLKTRPENSITKLRACGSTHGPSTGRCYSHDRYSTMPAWCLIISR